MSDTSAPAVDLTGLRRLLGESERDVAALSREEADRIIAIRDHDRRLRAYLRLRELWAYAGDRMAPEDEARIQASFSGEGTARDIEPPPAAPEIYQPLTPVSLLRWADAWRSALVASALKRSSDGADPGDMLALSAAVGGGQAGSEMYVPEIGIIGQLDTLIGELRDGLDARQLLPGEALQGQIGNLSGLVKVVAAARARRDMVVPPVPAMPASRCRVDEILDWLEALLLFEEAIGARALIQAGRVPEPGEARRQFLASARGGMSDIGGHAAAQLASWRHAESVHRAVSGAVRTGWLTRDRVIVLPSFDVTELEAFFGVFGGGLPALPAAPKAAGPAEAAGWWQQRRRVLVRSIALDLLADGTLRGIEDLDRRAEEMTIRGLVRILPEVGGLAEVDAVLAACSSAAARSGDAGTVPDAGEAAAVLSKWDRKAASGAFRPPAAPVPTPTKAEDAVVSPAPVRVVPDVEEVRTAVPPSQKMVTESRSSREPRRWREAIGRAISRAWFPLGAVVSVVIYQSVVLGFILIAWGGDAYRAEVALRLARAGDPLWLGAGALLVAAVLLLSVDLRPRAGRRGWSLLRFGRIVCAIGIGVWAITLQPGIPLVSSADGFPVWPEHVAQQGGVPASRIIASEGVWLRSRAVEPMFSEDLPQLEAGARPVILLREVGAFGLTRRWLVANRSDIEALFGRRLGDMRAAPSLALRKESAQ